MEKHIGNKTHICKDQTVQDLQTVKKLKNGLNEN